MNENFTPQTATRLSGRTSERCASLDPACCAESHQTKRRCVFRSAPSLSDLSTALLGTRDQVLACLKIQSRVRAWKQQLQAARAVTDECMPDEDECAICCSLLCEPSRWPAIADSECEHRFCKPCIAQWMAQQKSDNPTCPLCRAPALARLSRGAIEVDETEAARLAERHPCLYAERLTLHRAMSAQLRVHEQTGRVTMPVAVGFPEVQQRSDSYYWGYFSFSRTEHLNALAHALASPRRQMLVLSGEERGQGARGRVVTVTLSWWLLVRCRRSGVVRTAAGDADGGNVAASALLQALVARRTRWGQVCVELRVERACALAAPACDDEERLGVTMGEVRYR
ncbi:hypothetical protein EMIHUDRAFT_445826 [Emiliania huxleyi CCMP1516]|uniref:RING-type domain-containing protein n=2 Tax=Emiliania huxleyi TaxID=2903 RepID=A0A0D3IQT6_EMIH1|nr:hypothetical protein EMIHUDRAFT_445826 [Emiliania huxleyi CCMP1516]EOD13621.1 hypothetical protein EMIHUDRAFT_445826 [Emiliania huxleyi CCMP1516]|eukprot:XP_005766050.1 hypothetical protein EMIHUDRAFT_445826 [Emiliania huxleyi CCMP1516]